MFYTYVLESSLDGQLYIGYTSDLKRRFAEHNDGRVDATKHRRPFNLVYYEACVVQEDAIKREKALKTGFGRMYLKNRLSRE